MEKGDVYLLGTFIKKDGYYRKVPHYQCEKCFVYSFGKDIKDKLLKLQKTSRYKCF